MHRLFITAILLISYFSVRAQSDDWRRKYLTEGLLIDTNKTFYDRVPVVVPLNQKFTFSLTTENIDDSVKPALPFLKDFENLNELVILDSLTERNGIVHKSMTYNYSLLAKNPGMFLIPKIAIHSGAQLLETHELMIRVTEETPFERQRKDSMMSAFKGDGVYSCQISKDTVFMGEMLIATYQLKNHRQIKSLNFLGAPMFTGFLCYRTEVTPAPIINAGREIVNLSKYILYPEVSGALKIEPVALSGYIEVNPGSKLKGTNHGITDQDSLLLIPCDTKTNMVSVFVKPLPLAGKPVDFKGNVGDFKLEPISYPETKEIHIGEKISFIVTINGTGNLESVEAPEIKPPSSFKMSKPTIYTNDSVDENIGLTGSRQYRYTYVANEPGDFTIGDVSFSYFDPKSEKYISYTQPGFKVTVTKRE